MRAALYATTLALASSLTLGAGCGETQTAVEPRNLDRPSGLTFACYGDLRILGDGVADPEDDVTSSAIPLSHCKQWYHGDGPPEGQEDLEVTGSITPSPPAFYGFVLQSLPGTVAVVYRPTDVSGGVGATVLDTDDLTPGKNAIPIGVQPVDIVTDRDGCHVVTANAGSCDLSVLEVATAIGGDERAVVTHVPVSATGGAPILAKPAAIVAEPPAGEIGVECPEVPEGVLWIAYPGCHMAAAVESGTGEILAAVTFAEDGTAAISDGAVTCDAECGDEVVPPAASLAERPATLALTIEGDRLVIGAENGNILTVVELDDDHLPVSLQRLPLEGTIGVLDVAVSEVIEQGGSSGTLGGAGGQFQYVYAVATDGSVRVADILNQNFECDTQIDPRYIRDLRDVGLLSCLPIGSSPRRALADGPGIQVLNGVPVDVTILTQDALDDTAAAPEPDLLIGTFAFVTISDGNVVIVNIDDDHYADFEVVGDPLAVDLQIGMAHQPRDIVTSRDARSEGVDANGNPIALCTYPALDADEGGPRLSAPISQTVSSSQISPSKLGELPFVRNLYCAEEDADGEVTYETPISELSFMAPADVREAAFPSWLDNRLTEDWTVSWEGSLSIDTGTTSVDGPPVRQGIVDVGGDGMHLLDGSGPFCRVGVEPYDFVILRGCDPAAGDEQCGVDESCYVHPDSVVGTGHCLPSDQVDTLAEPCRDFLISRRRFTVMKTDAGDLKLGERRRTLRTTPIEGCLSADECRTHYEAELQLVSSEHPKDFELPAPEDQPTWACEPDPTRAPGPDRCMMTCEATEDCENGFVCSSGHCVEGVSPPRQCLTAAQFYEIHAGDAFAVIGERHGYLHDRIEGPDGECIDDVDANPLIVGRIPLTAPACAGDELTDLAPNPCSTTIEHTEISPNYADDGTCTSAGEDDLVITTRETTAIRFKNPAFTFHLVDPTITGDADCAQDRAGTLRPFPITFPNYQLAFTVRAGFTPMSLAINPFFVPVFPVKVVLGPDDGLWVIDEGDLFGSTFTTRGQVIRVDPRAPTEGDPLTLR